MKVKRFVFTFRVEPPDYTVSAKSGGSVIFAWFSRVTGQWWHVIPGGSLERIPPPEMIFVDEEYDREHPADLSKAPKVSHRQSKKAVQLSLF